MAGPLRHRAGVALRGAVVQGPGADAVAAAGGRGGTIPAVHGRAALPEGPRPGRVRARGLGALRVGAGVGSRRADGAAADHERQWAHLRPTPHPRPCRHGREECRLRRADVGRRGAGASLSPDPHGGGTPWTAGRFDRSGGPRRVLFGHMYEDPAIELRVFPPQSRVFCIASAGDMALELAPSNQVTAVDINPVQLAYARARLDGAPADRGTAERILDLGRGLLPLAG